LNFVQKFKKSFGFETNIILLFRKQKVATEIAT